MPSLDDIAKLKTVEGCEQYALNNEPRSPELAQAARRRAVELQAATHGAKTQVEHELLEAVYAYERTLLAKHGKRVVASYTWRLIDEHGIVPAIERVVTKDKETVGYLALVTMGLQNMAFEAVILRHPESFSDEAVHRAEERMRAWTDSRPPA